MFPFAQLSGTNPQIILLTQQLNTANSQLRQMSQRLLVAKILKINSKKKPTHNSILYDQIFPTNFFYKKNYIM